MRAGRSCGNIETSSIFTFRDEKRRYRQKNVDEQIFYGCYPRIYDKDIEPTDYYPNYIRTYVERDIRNIKQIGDLSLLFKFVKLCAGRIGQLLNKASLANECGI